MSTLQYSKMVLTTGFTLANFFFKIHLALLHLAEFWRIPDLLNVTASVKPLNLGLGFHDYIIHDCIPRYEEGRTACSDPPKSSTR